jgi:hypothetical protein
MSGFHNIHAQLLPLAYPLNHQPLPPLPPIQVGSAGVAALHAAAAANPAPPPRIQRQGHYTNPVAPVIMTPLNIRLEPFAALHPQIL